MMKRFMQFVLALPFVLAMFCSCNDDALDDKAMVSIKGLQETYEFEAIPDGAVSFTITTNVKWSIKVEGLDWAKITPDRGLASASAQTVVIEPAPNEEDEMRTGVMTVIVGDMTREVTLKQKAASKEAELKFIEGVADDGVLYVDAYNTFGTYLKLYSNRDWTAEAEEMSEWADLGPLQGVKGRYATICIMPESPNMTGGEIWGEITFTFDGQTKVLKVCQRSFVADLSVLDGGEAKTQLDARSIGDEFSLTVKSNADWSAVPVEDWVFISVMEGGYGDTELVLSVEPNETEAVRTATVNFNNNGKKVALKITQGDEFIKVDESSFSIKQPAQDLVLEVTSNQKWTATCPEPWLTLSPSSATGNADVTIAVAAAPENEVRTAVITIKADNMPDLYKEVRVLQGASFVDINVNPIMFSAQQKWNVEHNPDYASSGETGAESGKGTGRLCSYTYPDNNELYAQVVNANNFGMVFIMPEPGIAFKPVWENDAIEFHIPVIKVEKGKHLHFDFGLMGTTQAPKFWNTEISLDGGKNWASFDTGEPAVNATGTNRLSNTCLPGGESNTPKTYKTKYQFPKTVENTELIVRIICVDGTVQNNGTIRTNNKPHGSGTFRVIGADHDTTKDEVQGPTFSIK